MVMCAIKEGNGALVFRAGVTSSKVAYFRPDMTSYQISNTRCTTCHEYNITYDKPTLVVRSEAQKSTNELQNGFLFSTGVSKVGRAPLMDLGKRCRFTLHSRPSATHANTTNSRNIVSGESAIENAANRPISIT